MSHLEIYHDTQSQTPFFETADGAEISKILAEIGVRFHRWQADAVLDKNATDQDVIQAYQREIQKLQADYGYQAVDVIRLDASHPDKNAIRQKFLNEHTHSEDEVRFFVEGSGMFYLHADNKVFRVLCEANDLISVPDNTPHWFDMSDTPHLTCIRLFTNPAGWVAEFTKDDIAQRFPLYEKQVSVC